jgi:predicted DNA-binding transcriptional regulator AlpA
MSSAGPVPWWSRKLAESVVAEHMNTVDDMALLTVLEVCAELGVSRSTWEKWRARRVGPAVIRLPNGELRVRRSELEAWLLSREAA